MPIIKTHVSETFTAALHVIGKTSRSGQILSYIYTEYTSEAMGTKINKSAE